MTTREDEEEGACRGDGGRVGEEMAQLEGLLTVGGADLCPHL